MDLSLTGIISQLGSCSRCMKKAFLIAVVAWCAVPALYLLGNWYLFAGMAGVAASLTLLWLAHVFTYAGRHAFGSVNVPAVFVDRRRVLTLFLKTAAAGAVISFPTAAHAWSSCGGWSSGDCNPCERRQTATSSCTRCRSCGNGCGNYVC